MSVQKSAGLSRRAFLGGAGAVFALGAAPRSVAGRPGEPLARAARLGLVARLGSPPPTYLDRLGRELDQLEAAGVTEDVLRVHTVASAAARDGLMTGPGRGASSGSLVLWCLGITGVDPVRDELHFERWLNPLRASPVDIDLEVPETELERLARAVPVRSGEARVRLGFPDRLDVPWTERRAAVAVGARSGFESFASARIDSETWIGARRADLDRDARIVNLVGLPVLTSLGEVPEADEAIGLSLVAKGCVEGVHFLHRFPEAVKLVSAARPSRREDLAALLALCRPKPIAAGLAREYLDLCRANRRAAPPHPAIDPFLIRTRGMLVYQEQLMSIMTGLARYSLAEADMIWRELTKGSEAASAIRTDFCRRCLDEAMSFEEASALFAWLHRRAGLLFNRAYMIASTALISRSAAARASSPARYLARFRAAETAARQRLLAECSRIANAFGHR